MSAIYDKTIFIDNELLQVVELLLLLLTGSQKEFRGKSLPDWSAGDVCDWLDSLFMPEYKVGHSPTYFPANLSLNYYF